VIELDLMPTGRAHLAEYGFMHAMEGSHVSSLQPSVPSKLRAYSKYICGGPCSHTMDEVQASLETLTGRRTVPNVFVGGR
jgi:hypothetical protein